MARKAEATLWMLWKIGKRSVRSERIARKHPGRISINRFSLSPAYIDQGAQGCAPGYQVFSCLNSWASVYHCRLFLLQRRALAK